MVNETKKTERVGRSTADNIEKARYAFEMVKEKYSMFSRNMSERDQRNLRRYVHYLISLPEVEANDLALVILECEEPLVNMFGKQSFPTCQRIFDSLSRPVAS